MTMLQLETPGSKTVPVQGNAVRGWKFAIRCLGSGVVEAGQRRRVSFEESGVTGLSSIVAIVAFATVGMG